MVRYLIQHTEHEVLNLDKLTYAGNLKSLISVENDKRYTFQQIDICDAVAIRDVLRDFQPDGIMHLAAESHVDRSIDNPEEFIQTNIVGTYTLLQAALAYWRGLPEDSSTSSLPDSKTPTQSTFRFHHVSSDEVYGDLKEVGYFTEDSSYAPSSPYSASKASSDHLVRAWHRTFGLPVLISNSSNSYGPYQFCEKLIPSMILNAIEGKPLNVYGDGMQIRDWLYVEDHAQALVAVLTKGKIGETYNIGGNNEKQNIEVVQTLCDILDEKAPLKFQLPTSTLNSYHDLITHVKDRPGHDKRYAIDASKIKNELGWKPKETFNSGINKTVDWYLTNSEWCQHVQDESYQRERLGKSEMKKSES